MNYNIQEIYKKINPVALENLKSQLSDRHFALCLEGIRRPRIESFRLNPLKGDRLAVLEDLRRNGIKFHEFSAIPNAFQLKSPQKELQNTKSYQSGAIYMQGLSGMMAAYLLDVENASSVLDLAASPGSKTTMIAALMNNKGKITALEPDYIRMERLKHNCEILGVENVVFHQTKAQSFDDKNFERILADVPCSGEGRFNLYDTASYRFWRANDPEKFSNLQKKILTKAIENLAPGGRIVYSTCTLNYFENESVVEEILAKDTSLECVEVPLPKIPVEEFVAIKKGQVRALRIIPSDRFEGFFYCVIKKN